MQNNKHKAFLLLFMDFCHHVSLKFDIKVPLLEDTKAVPSDEFIHADLQNRVEE